MSQIARLMDFRQQAPPYLRMQWCVFTPGSYTLSTTMTTARVYLTPIQIPFRAVVDRIGVVALGVWAGNMIAGIYEDNGDTPAGGAVVEESASLAKGAINSRNEYTIADTVVEAMQYWLAFESDEATSTFLRPTLAVTQGGTLQTYRYDRAGGYGALTDPCPAVTQDNTASPVGYLRIKEILGS